MEIYNSYQRTLRRTGQKMRRAQRMIIALLIAVSAVVGTPAQAVPSTGTTGCFEWEDNGTSVTITAGSTCVGTATIPATIALGGHNHAVTAIATDAFRDNVALTSVVFPNSVTTIGNSAFLGDSNLASVTFGSGLRSIGTSTFYGATSLTTISLPNAPITIGDHAFDGTANVSRVNLGTGVTSIGKYAFANNTSLLAIAVPNSTTSIGDYAFQSNTSLSSVTLGSGLTAIGKYAFAGDSAITAISIPNHVLTIGDYAFYNNLSLTSLNLGTGLVSIGSSTFYGASSLTSVSIPNSVTSIGDYAFYGSDAIGTALTKVSIGTGLTNIGNFVFASNTNLTNVDLPSTLVRMSGSAFQGDLALKVSMQWKTGYALLGWNTADDYSGDSYVGDSLNTYLSDGGSALFSQWIENGTCSGGGTITVVNNVVTGHNSCVGFVALPTGTTSIDDQALKDNPLLTEVSIPTSIVSIGFSAFEGDTGIQLTVQPRTAYNFAGWSETEEFAGTIYSGAQLSTYLSDGSLALYPKWNYDQSWASTTARTLKVKKTYSAKVLAGKISLSIPTKATISVVTSTATKKYCVKSGSSVKALKTGNCLVTFKIQRPKTSLGVKPPLQSIVMQLIVKP